MQEYETEEDEMITESQVGYPYSIKKLKTKKDSSGPGNKSYWVAKYWVNELRCDLNKLLKTKELSIINPTKFDQVIDPEFELQALWMIYEDLQFSFISSLKPEQKLISAIQLALQRFEEQEINLKISEEMLVVYEGRIYINLLQYIYSEYKQYECIESYKRIVNLLVPNAQQQVNHKQTYAQIIDYLVSGLKPNYVDHFNVPYLWLLQLIIMPADMKQTGYMGNSYIYELVIPDSLKYKQLNPHKKKIVIKSTKLPERKDSDYEQKIKEINQNVNREIAIFEKFKPDDHVLQCWAYIKIYDQTFIFMDKHYDLQDYLKQIRNERLFGYKLYIKLALDFSKSLLTLHKHGIKHRDLKEGNLFVSDMDQDFGRLYVGDFDRSKPQDIDQTFSNVQEMTSGYNSPEVLKEEGHTQKSDIWQFGLILCKMACADFSIQEFRFYVYLAQQKSIRENPQQTINDPTTNPFQNIDKLIISEFDKESLNDNEKNKRDSVLPRIITLIYQCLEEDQARRPSANEIHKELHDLYWNIVKGIKKSDVDPNQSLKSTSEMDSLQKVYSNPIIITQVTQQQQYVTLLDQSFLGNNISPMREVQSPIRIIKQTRII